MQDKILVVDVETGGLQEGRHSLLSATFAKISDRWERQEIRTWFIQQDEYIVTPRAMELNRIDISQASTWTRKEVFLQELLEFLDLPANIATGSQNTRGRWLIRGKNPSFDSKFIREFFGAFVYDSMFLYWTECVQEWYDPLVRLGVFGAPKSRKLENLCRNLKIEVDDTKTHSSEYDVLLTIALGRKCVEVEDKIRGLIQQARSKRAR